MADPNVKDASPARMGIIMNTTSWLD